jgi:hypothetical protein
VFFFCPLFFLFCLVCWFCHHLPLNTSLPHQPITSTKQPVLPQTWPIRTLGPSPGSHMLQPQLHQHPGKLGSAPGGIPERNHNGIFHPVFCHGTGQQDIPASQPNSTGKLSVPSGKPGEMDRVWNHGQSPDGSRRRTRESTTTSTHRRRWYVPNLSPCLLVLNTPILGENGSPN